MTFMNKKYSAAETFALARITESANVYTVKIEPALAKWLSK